jgi:neutral ceramidase
VTVAGLEAGFGTAMITPPTPVQLAGFIEDQPATEVHDDLEVRALFLRGEAGSVCLLVCDLLGMSAGFSRPIRDGVATELGLDRAEVLTSCVHTHAGPSTIEGSDQLGWVTPDGYRELLVERGVAAARAAAVSPAPAVLRAGRWPLPEGLSVNRRGLPYEPSFAVLDVVDRGGARLGTLANVAIHPVALGPECLAVSSDWVGPFRRELERRTGGTAMLLSGALGDVNPHHVHRQDNDCGHDGFAEAEALGQHVAEGVEAVLAEAEPVEASGPAVVRHRTVDVTLGSTLLTGGRTGRHVQLELLEWSVGPVRLVSVPGEAFHALGRAVEDRVGHEGGLVLLAGLAPEWHGYLPAPFTDGYEESMSYGREAVAAIAHALAG